MVGVGSDRRDHAPSAIAFSVAIAVCLLGYLLVATTLGVHWIESWHDEQRALQITVLSLTGILIWWQLVQKPAWGLARPPILLLAIFLFGLTSALSSGHIGHGLAELALHSILLVTALGVALAVAQRGVGALRTAGRLALLLALGHVVGILTRYAAALQLRDPMSTTLLLLGSANPRFPSALYALLMPLLAALAVDCTERRGLRWAANVALALLWCFNIALQTRALAFAYIVAAPVVVATLGWRAASELVIRLAVTAVLGTVLYAVMFLGIPAWIGTGLAQASREGLLGGSGREALLAMSWESIRQSPWLGIGPMGFAAIPNRIGAHPHNWIVQLAVEWGLPAALLAVAGVVFGLWKASRRIREMFVGAQPSAPLSVGAFFAVVVGLVYSLVDGNLVMPISQTAFVIVVGILLGALMSPGEQAVNVGPTARGLRVALLAVSLASSIYLVWYVAQTLPQQEARRAWHERNRVPTPYLLPRFWEQGLIPPAQQMLPAAE